MKLTRGEIAKLCIAGSYAPSGGNAQPWKVIAYSDRLEIALDHVRSDSFIDVGRFASFFALGCFCENVFLAAEGMGLIYELQYIQGTNIKKPIIAIKFVDRKKDKKEPLYEFIPRRITNRKLSDGRTIDKQLIAEIEKIVNDFGKGFKLTAFSNKEKKNEIADILGIADRIRTLNKKLFVQMMSEFRWSEREIRETKDGLDLKTLELPTNMDKIFLLLKKFPDIRNVLPHNILEDMAKPLILNCSHISCLSASLPLSSRTMIDAGILMEKLWLTATMFDISVHPWSVITFILMRAEYFSGEGFSLSEKNEIKKIGLELRRAFGLVHKEVPIFIFRLSYSPKPSARSLRIPWESFTKIRVQ